jgi:hypothetical protein
MWAQRRRSIFEKHDFGGFDYGGNLVADFEFHFFGAATSDDAFDEILADADDDVSHDAAELEFFDGAFQGISSGECHKRKDTLGSWKIEDGKWKVEADRESRKWRMEMRNYSGRRAKARSLQNRRQYW